MMSAALHFANLAPSAKKTTLLSVLDGEHKFSHKETMQAHLSNGGLIDTWPYYFSLVIISDKTKSELEYLTEEVYLEPSNESTPKYKFLEPEYDTSEYWEMRNTGQIILTFAEFEPFIGLN